jgi:hypothetical protein
MHFDLSTSIMKLYNGRRSFALHVNIGRRGFGLYRWDTQRAPADARPFPGHINRWHRDIWRGPTMTWYLGGSTLAPRPAADDGVNA